MRCWGAEQKLVQNRVFCTEQRLPPGVLLRALLGLEGEVLGGGNVCRLQDPPLRCSTARGSLQAWGEAQGTSLLEDLTDSLDIALPQVVFVLIQGCQEGWILIRVEHALELFEEVVDFVGREGGCSGWGVTG